MQDQIASGKRCELTHYSSLLGAQPPKASPGWRAQDSATAQQVYLRKRSSASARIVVLPLPFTASRDRIRPPLHRPVRGGDERVEDWVRLSSTCVVERGTRQPLAYNDTILRAKG